MECQIEIDDAAPLRLRVPLDAPGEQAAELLRAGTGSSGPWQVDGIPLECLQAGRTPWKEGSIVRCSAGNPADGRRDAENRDPSKTHLSLRTVDGPSTGEIFPLTRGRHVLGKDGADITLDDPALEPREAELVADAWGLRICRPGGEVERIHPNQSFRLGRSEFLLEDRKNTREQRPARRPTTPVPPELRAVTRGTGVATLIISAGLPLVGGVLVAWLLGTWIFLIFAGISTLTALIHFLLRGSSRAHSRRELQQAILAEALRVESAVPRLGEILTAEQPPRRIPLSFSSSESLWVDWGRGTRAPQLHRCGGTEIPLPRLDGARIITCLTIPHALPAHDGLIDAALSQLVARGFLIRIDHSRSAPGPEFLTALKRRWASSGRIISSPSSETDPNTELFSQQAPLLCLSLHTEGNAEDAISGPGVVVLRLDQEEAAPWEDSAMVRFETFGRGYLIHPPRPADSNGPGGGDRPLEIWGFGEPAAPQLLSDPSFPSHAARRRLCAEQAQRAAVSSPQADLLSQDSSLTIEDLPRRWHRTRHDPRTVLILGHSPREDATVSCDLTLDGPHMLVAGTTGSGKSEFLRSLLLNLALRHAPERLGMVLIDFKGGASFGPLAALPHVHRLVTDLAEHEVQRDLAFLHAEVLRREHLLREHSVSDWAEYLRLTQPRPELPELFVCVDEFRMLVETFPEAMTQLLKIATVGRSLGLRLILSTQRPQGAISSDIRANVSLTICLRVAGEMESHNILGSAAAAHIPAITPGRGFVMTSTGLQEFQSQLADALPHRNTPLSVLLDSAGRVLAQGANTGVSSPAQKAPDDDDAVSKVAPMSLSESLRDFPTSPSSGILPVIPPPLSSERFLLHAPSASSIILTQGAGLELGMAEQPSRGRQFRILWSPSQHGPLEITGTPEEQAQRLLLIAARAAAVGSPIYAITGDPRLRRRLRAATGHHLHGALDPADPLLIDEGLSTLQQCAESERTADSPAPVLLVHGVDRIGEDLLRCGVPLETLLERLCTAVGDQWWIALGSGRALPKALSAICPHRWWAGPAAREDFDLMHPRQTRDLLPTLDILTGPLTGTAADPAHPAGLTRPADSPEPQRNAELSQRLDGGSQRRSSRWPRLHALPEVLPWRDPSPDAPTRRGRASLKAGSTTIPLTLGEASPCGEEAVLPLLRKGMGIVLGQSGTGKTQLITALQVLNPQVDIIAADAASPLPVPSISADHCDRESRGACSPSSQRPCVLVIDQAEQLSTLSRDEGLRERFAPGCTIDAVLLLAQTPRFSGARSPWAAMLQQAPAVVILGRPTGFELDFREEEVPTGHSAVPAGRGLIISRSGRTRFQAPLVGDSPPPEDASAPSE